MAAAKNRFWKTLLWWSIIYFPISIIIDFIWNDVAFSSIYLLKRATAAIAAGFIFSLLISPDNPFRKKKIQ